MKHVIIFGAPGSGKGTQGKKIKEKFGLNVLSTGELLREEVLIGSEIGQQCSKIIEKGLFPGDDIIFKLVTNFLSKNSGINGILYDGFPRTLAQATFLMDLVKDRHETISSVINIQVDKNVLVKRITGRLVCANCEKIYNTYYSPPVIKGQCDVCQSTSFQLRKDDTEDTLKTRLKIYEESTLPILDFFVSQQLKIINVDGMQSENDVFHQIENVI